MHFPITDNLRADKAVPTRAGRTGRWAVALRRAVPQAMWIACLCCVSSAASDALRGAPDTATVHAYRRVLVPADRSDDWPKGGVRYAPPVSQAEFERLTEKLKVTVPDATAVKIAEAVYSARFDGQQLVDGTARLKIVRLGENARFVPLVGCGLAIQDARSLQPSELPAALGRTPDGQLVAVVDPTAEDVEFTWSLRGAAPDRSDPHFAVRLPQCPLNRLVLELPPGWVPEVAGSRVSEVPDPDPADGSPAASGNSGHPAAATAVAEETRRWQIDLGGHTSFALRILPADPAARPASAILCAQNVRYRLLQDAVEVSSSFRIDPAGAEVDKLVIELDPQLTITQAWLGPPAAEEPIAWLSAVAEPDRPRQVMLELPRKLEGPEQLVRLRAVGLTRLGSRWSLPALRPAGMTWLATRWELEISEPLVLQQVHPRHCLQTQTSPLPAPQRGRLLAFTCLKPDAGLDIVVERPANRIEVESGTTIVVSPDSITARVVADVRAEQGERFQLLGEVPENWEVDSVGVTTDDENQQPVSVLADWEPVVQGRRQQLVISLSRPVSPERPLRCVVQGRRRNASRQKLSVEDFRFLRFPQADRARYVMSIITAGPRPLQLEGGGSLSRLTPDDLSAEAADRVDAPPGSLVFSDDEDASTVVFSLGSEKPKYAAIIDVDATVASDALTESYRIRCVPESSALSQILVHVSQSREPVLSWTLDGGDPEPLAALPLSLAEREAAGLGSGGQSWRVQLPGPQSQEFTISGRRKSPLAAETPIALVAVPEAAAQRASLTVHAATSSPLLINNRRLRAVPLPDTDPDRTTTVRAAYRYEPSRDALSAAEAAVSVTQSPRGEDQPGAWLWNIQLVSRYGPEDVTQHVAVLRIENASRKQLVVRVPAGATVRRVAIEGDGPVVDIPFENGQQLVLPLPRGVRYPTAAITYQTADAARSCLGQVTAAFPLTDVPVLSRRWDVWLPAGCEFAGQDPRFSTPRLPPPSLGERLLGPLWRGRSGEAFNLFSPAAWWGLASPRADEKKSYAAAEKVLAYLDDVIRPTGRPTARGSWRDLFQEYWVNAQLERSPPLPMLVDTHALRAAGIVPSAAVDVAGDDDSKPDAKEFFSRAHLVLLVASDSVLLTTATAVSRYRDQLADTGLTVVRRVLAGPLRGAMTSALADRSAFVRLEAWLQSDGADRPPWHAAAIAPLPTLLDRGWTMRSLQVESDEPAGAAYYRPAIVRGLAWVLFFAVTLFLFAYGGRRFIDWVIAACLAALVAWLVPQPLHVIGTGMFLGVLAAGLLRLPMARRSRARPSPPPEDETVGSTVPAALLLAAALAVAAAGPAIAQETRIPAPDNVAPETRNVHRVLVPVRADGTPTGLIYLPQDFYDVLYRLDRGAGASPQAWWLKSARYRATIDWQGGGNVLAVVKLTAIYQIDVIEQNAMVRLPLQREGRQLAPASATIDGRPVPPVWDERGAEIGIRIESSGEHRIEVNYVGTQGEKADALGFDLGIPAVANAQLELTLPTDAPPIDLPTTLGRIVDRPDEGRITADLGPADRLAVRWLESGLATSEVEVEQLLWVDVHPGAVRLAAKLGVHVERGQLHRLRLTTNRGLQLRTHRGPAAKADMQSAGDAPAPAPATVSMTAGTEDAHIFDIFFEQPITDTAWLELDFLLTDTPGLGKFMLPRIETVDATTIRRLVAISAEPGLNIDDLPGDTVQPLSGELFTAAWGGLPSVPRRAYRLSSDEQTAWNVVVSQAAPVTRVRQQTIATVGRDRISVNMVAQLATSGGSLFGHTIAVPRPLKIDTVEFSCAGKPRRLRWSRHRPEPAHPSDEITLRLFEPAEGSQQIEIRGSMPVRRADRGGGAGAKGETVTLVPARILDAEYDEQQIQLQRRFGALIENVRLTDLSPHEVAADAPEAPGVWSVGTWDVSGAKPQIKMIVRPNNPSTQATFVTRVDRQAESWRVELDLWLEVQEVDQRKGLVDLIQFDVPFEVVEPLVVDPPCDARIVTEPGSGTRRLVVRPPQPIAKDLHLRIVAPLAISPGEPMRVPEVVPREIDDVNRFVIVPVQLDRQEIEWQTEGLRPEVLPDPVAASTNLENATVYIVATAPSRATLKAVRRTAGDLRVLLADTQLAARADGTFYGVTRFQLVPAGRTGCTLQLPPSCRLIQVTVADVPGLLYPLGGKNQWRLDLGPDQLPQQIVVFYEGRSAHWADQNARLHVETPVLKNVPIEQSLLTLHPLAAVGETELPRSVQRVAALSQVQTRLRTGLDVMDLPANVLAETPPGDLARWYLPWAREQFAATRDQDYLQRRFGRSDRQLDEQWAARQQQWAARLGTTAVNERAQQQAARVLNPAGLFAPATPLPSPAVHASAANAVTEITVRLPHAAGSDLPQRLLAGVYVLAGALALGFLHRRGRLGDFLVTYPQLVGVVLGLAWWLWLQPSILGWVIVVISITARAHMFSHIAGASNSARARSVSVRNGSRH